MASFQRAAYPINLTAPPIPYSLFPRVSREAGVVAFAILLGAYLSTLAPGLTLWDAGEFQSAVATLGIPHPPGAPLYILIGRAFTLAFPPEWLPFLLNLLSAVATAGACAIVADRFANWCESRVAGLTAALVGGVMLSVWRNATETEVYALSLLAGMLLIWIGDRAGALWSWRHSALLAYAMGLAAALHLDALVAAPAALVLAASGPGTGWPSIRRLLFLTPPFVLAVGLGRASLSVAAAGLVLAVVAAIFPLPEGTHRQGRQLGMAVLVVAGVSVVLFMLVRATHDPFINQGNPATWDAFIDVVAREQYAVPGLWPRRAPLWLQTANIVQYADWQVAFGVDQSPAASWWRTPPSVAAGVLGIIGARVHRRIDVRSFRAWSVFALTGTLGVMLVLNLEAGPSIGFGVLPQGAGHEARERDYFFAPGFLALAAWAGLGVWHLLRRITVRGREMATFAPLVAIVPLALNWSAADRSREPMASLPTRFAEAVLASVPQDAVLLLAGDNDSYTVWHAQAVRGERRDVAAMTLPLLGADWYRAELIRRHRVFSPEVAATWYGREASLADAARLSALASRPFVAAVSVDVDTRRALGGVWVWRGMVRERLPGPVGAALVDSVDLEAARRLAEIVRAAPESALERADATERYLEALLRCPAAAVRLATGERITMDKSLDSLCNSR